MKIKSPIPDIITAIFAMSILPAIGVAVLAFVTILFFGWIVGAYWAVLAGLIITMPFTAVYVLSKMANVVEFTDESVLALFTIGGSKEHMISEIIEVRRKSYLGISHLIQVFTSDEKNYFLSIDPLNIRKLEELLGKHNKSIF